MSGFGQKRNYTIMRLTTKIKSHHHTLNPEAFELFMQPNSSLRISDVRPDEFLVTLESQAGEADGVFFGRANEIVSFYLMALNVATLGSFSWDFKFISPISYFRTQGDANAVGEQIFFQVLPTYKYDEVQLTITPQLVWQSLKIMLSLGSEKNSPLVGEYIKGIYNLHQSFLSYNFANEAFANFYKALEYFCTVYFFKKDRLDNEKSDIKNMLRDFGFNEEVVNDFDPIYIVRETLNK